MLSLEDAKKYPKHFKVWEQDENPIKSRKSKEDLEDLAESTVVLEQKFLDFTLQKSEADRILQSCLKIVESPNEAANLLA